MTDDARTLRLLFPQWQGKGEPAYGLGARLLDWLAPARPGDPVPGTEGIPSGWMALAHVVRVLREVAAEVDVVGLGITEHLPWDAVALKEGLAQMPLLGAATRSPAQEGRDVRGCGEP